MRDSVTTSSCTAGRRLGCRGADVASEVPDRDLACAGAVSAKWQANGTHLCLVAIHTGCVAAAQSAARAAPAGAARHSSQRGTIKPAPAGLRTATRTCRDAASRLDCISKAEEVGVEVLLMLAVIIPLSRSPQPSSSSTTAAAAGAGAQAARVAAAGDLTQTPVFNQSAGALFAVLECCHRAEGALPLRVSRLALHHAIMCCMGPAGNPNLLLQLAQEGTAEQRVGFFNILVTLLKLSYTPAICRMANAGTLCRLYVALAAVEMLLFELPARERSNAGGTFTSNSSSGGEQEGSRRSSGTTATPWLLLPAVGSSAGADACKRGRLGAAYQPGTAAASSWTYNWGEA